MPTKNQRIIPVPVREQAGDQLMALVQLTGLSQAEVLRHVLAAAFDALIQEQRMVFPLKFSVVANGPHSKTTPCVVTNGSTKAPVELMNKSEMAKWLRIAERTLDYYVQQRKIPFIKLGGKVRFDVAVVREHLIKCKPLPTIKQARTCRTNTALDPT